MRVKLSKTTFSQSEFKVANSVLKSGWLTHGEYNKKFENLFKKFTKTKYALTLNSCTSALELAIKCQNITKEVIVPSFTWVSSANAIISSGAKPVFCDSDYKTRNIKLENIIPLVNKNTQAVMVVHYGGQCCEMDKIYKYCNKKKIKIIEDSAETLGGTWKNKHPGNWGVGCFSFFPTKNITTAEGGMITCNSKELFLKFKAMAAHGIPSQSYDREKKKTLPWYKYAVMAGHNYRMSNMLAAIGFEQLKKIKKLNGHRIKAAKKYNLFFKKNKIPIQYPFVSRNAKHVYQTYAINVNEKIRNDLIVFLRKKGVEASVHFTPVLHEQKFFKRYIPKYKKLPNASKLSKTLISLPMHSKLKNKEIDYVCYCLKKYFKMEK